MIPEQGASPSPAFLTIQCTLVLGLLPISTTALAAALLRSLRSRVSASVRSTRGTRSLTTDQSLCHSLLTLPSLALPCGCLPLSSYGALPPRAHVRVLSLRCSRPRVLSDSSVLSRRFSPPVVPLSYGYILACYLRILLYISGFLN